VLREYAPVGKLPTEHIPTRRRDALRLLGLDEDDAGLQQRLTGFRRGRCLMRDHQGRISPVQVDLGDARAELEHPRAELAPATAPDSRYVRRMADFRAVEPLALWGFLTAGRYATCPAGRTLIAEGDPSDACYVTINGAVEKVIARGPRRIRAGLAGPGQPFGYESLIDGLPSPVTHTTRERTLLLIVGREAFERLYGGETAESHVVLDVILRNLMASLRQVLRPQARLASGSS
jgi:hypothetical protein